MGPPMSRSELPQGDEGQVLAIALLGPRIALIDTRALAEVGEDAVSLLSLKEQIADLLKSQPLSSAPQMSGLFQRRDERLAEGEAAMQAVHVRGLQRRVLPVI